MTRTSVIAFQLACCLFLTICGCWTTSSPPDASGGGDSVAAGEGGTPGSTVGGATVTPAGGGSPAPAAASDTPVPGVYRVSPTGDDSTGNGSEGRPWRTFGYALSQGDGTHGTPEIIAAAGTYDERLAINRSVTITGAGSESTTVHKTDVSNTDFVIRTGDGVSLGGPSIAVRISGIRISGENGRNGGVHAARTNLTLDGVNVAEPGGFGVVIEPDSPPFSIVNSTIGFIGLLYSDVGIDVGSRVTGTISNCTLGDHIDHAISIGVGCNVTIDNCRITGSTIYWADGIRIQGASNVTISNTTMVRPPGSDPAVAGPMHNPPHAGIEIAAASNGSTTVSVSNCTVRGFDVGIGVNMVWNSARIQNCTLGGNVTADVQTRWSGTAGSGYPVVDFGGGPLGSTGGNDFGSGSELAVQLLGPYDVSVFGATWGVATGLIEGRILDKLDDPSLGRALH
ncbi:MAG: right-handed parallel beta-helix repeat-containing protein [Planctomycetes bacterium]|nr:right-handed parallel beta-helix repeat-containing protein [Planctomycetota bacterium]